MSDDTQLADELDRIYDVVDSAQDEVKTQRESAVLGLLLILTDYGKDIALQREYPTPNQKLFEAVAGAEPEDPPDPGYWPDYAGDHDEFRTLVEWTAPEKGEVPVDERE